MNVLNHEHIAELISHPSQLCISLFMPTHRAGRERQQDAIRLKNLISTAREEFLKRNESAGAADKLLQPASKLPSEDDTLWRHRKDGLACFCAPDFFRAYRVPIHLKEQMFVGDRFQIRPLLPLLRSDARLYILALTQESAKLYEATKYSMAELELPELSPIEVDGTERPLQYHAHQAPSQGKGAVDTAMYHGHGGPTDREKQDTLKFFQLVDPAVRRVLRGQRSPLVLACVGYLASLYESANRYRHLIKGKVPGSPDRWSEEELREHAWKIVEPQFLHNQQKAWQEFQDANSNGRASDELESVVLAADEGRVGTLFLARGEQRWGRVEPERQTVHLNGDADEGEELLDHAAAQTLSKGGEVYLLDSLPETDSPIAATFRY